MSLADTLLGLSRGAAIAAISGQMFGTSGGNVFASTLDRQLVDSYFAAADESLSSGTVSSTALADALAGLPRSNAWRRY